MRTEILAKRLADKCSTPLLEQVLLKVVPVTDLSMECMIWTGRVSGTSNVPRLKKGRDSQNLPYMHMVTDRSYSVIVHEGRRVVVHRLIHQLLFSPVVEFRMRSLCGGPRCINPMHWFADPVTQQEELAGVRDITFASDDWTEGDVEELIDILLTENPPRRWDEVVNSPIMDGVPADMIRQVLTKIGKRHLL